MESLRKGNIFVTTGDLISELDVKVQAGGKSPWFAQSNGNSASIGETLTIPGKSKDVTVTVRMKDPNAANTHGDKPKVDHVDLIMEAISHVVFFFFFYVFVRFVLLHSACQKAAGECNRHWPDSADPLCAYTVRSSFQRSSHLSSSFPNYWRSKFPNQQSARSVAIAARRRRSSGRCRCNLPRRSGQTSAGAFRYRLRPCRYSLENRG